MPEADVLYDIRAEALLDLFQEGRLLLGERVMHGGLEDADGEDATFQRIGRGLLCNEVAHRRAPDASDVIQLHAIIEFPLPEEPRDELCDGQGLVINQRPALDSTPLGDEPVAEALLFGSAAHDPAMMSDE